MTVTMDSAGRVVLPKAIRERARLVAGTPLEIRVIDGRIEIEPGYAAVRVEQRRGFWVAAPTTAMPVLTQDEVDTTAASVRTGGFAGGDVEPE